MILILINEMLRIFFCGIPATTTNPYNDKVFGNGSPWWHIQDTTVAMFHFNGNYDIHVGGLDLCYPTLLSTACDSYGTFMQNESCKVLDACRHFRH